jgi:hypothetical protein
LTTRLRPQPTPQYGQVVDTYFKRVLSAIHGHLKYPHIHTGSHTVAAHKNRDRRQAAFHTHADENFRKEFMPDFTNGDLWSYLLFYV